MSLSKELAQFIVNTKYEDLPENVVEFTKLCILDWLGSGIAGKEKPPIQMIREFVNEMGGNPQATALTGERTSVVNAAMINGAASHIVELDDIHKESIIHAATVVIPAALSIAEARNATGKEFITAVAIGYDVCYRIGEAVSPSHYYFWHNTATCGTYGATAAAAKLLGLNTDQIVHALGNAGTQAAGLWEFIEDGAMSKQLHPAKAAVNGLTAALLAEKGFTGAQKILEGKRGFFQAMSEAAKSDKITNNLGNTFKIIENSFKIHASCRHTHPTIDLIIDLKKKHHLNEKDISKIKVKTYQVVLNITDNPNPSTIYASKFSIQFCTALAFFRESAGLFDFNNKTLEDKEIREFIKKIEVSVDPIIEANYPKMWGSKVEVELTDGQTLTLQTDYPKGDPENAVGTEELIEKFQLLANDLPEKQTEAYIQSILNLEHIQNMGEFFFNESLC